MEAADKFFNKKTWRANRIFELNELTPILSANLVHVFRTYLRFITLTITFTIILLQSHQIELSSIHHFSVLENKPLKPYWIVLPSSMWTSSFPLLIGLMVMSKVVGPCGKIEMEQFKDNHINRRNKTKRDEKSVISKEYNWIVLLNCKPLYD